MSRKAIFGWSIVLFAALATTFAAPADAHARRRCYNGGYSNYGRTYAYTAAYTAPVAATSPCAGNPPPPKADGRMIPQPAPAAPANPAAPAPAPAPEYVPAPSAPSTGK